MVEHSKDALCGGAIIYVQSNCKNNQLSQVNTAPHKYSFDTSLDIYAYVQKFFLLLKTYKSLRTQACTD